MNVSKNTLRVIAILVIALIPCSCSRDNRGGIPPYLHDLPQELAYHLVHSDDSTFVNYAREVGPVPLSDAVLKIHVQISQMSLEDYESSYDDITAYEKRIVRYLSESKLYGTNLADFIKRHRLPPDSLQLLYKLQNKSLQIYGDPGLSDEEKVEQYLILLEAFEKFDDKAHIGLIKTKIFRAYADLGKEREYLHYLKSAISDFCAIEYYPMVCQCLGVLGYIHRKTGDIDSMIVCYNEAKRIAYQYKIPNQAARILNFYSAYYYDRGRLSIAHNLRKEALKICREYKGDYYLMTPLLSAMKFYIKLECWDVVSELLEQARVLERLYEKDYDIDLDILRNRQMEAQVLMARGDVARANALYRKIERPVKELPYKEEYPNMLRYWSQGLIGNGNWKQALNPIHKGFKYSIENALPIKAVTFALLMAQAEYQLGHGQQFELALEHFDHYASGYREEFWREWVKRDALEGMHLLITGQQNQVVSMLDSAIKRLQAYIKNTDASTHSYLWLNKSKEMKQFLANITSHDPSLGYGADLFWRRLYQDLGACSRTEADPIPFTKIMQQPADSFPEDAGKSILARFKEIGDDVQMRVAELDAVHCMYRVSDDDIARWTVSKSGITCDTLSCTPDMLRELVYDTYSRILDNITKNEIHPSRALIHKLHELAKLLLPAEILRPSNSATQPLLLITPDTFLDMIPFEALNIESGESYAPLLLHYDVAYMRYMNPPGRRDKSQRGLILAYGGGAGDLQERSTFNPELAEVSSEASAVAVMDPDAIMLSGIDATKATLMTHWEDVSYIYIATHIIRDPQVPYLVHIPLAFPGGNAGPEAAYLDITDIRSADLTGCEIVVLSGCASGAPYIESRVVGPSLADAFLDAGAGVTVQTFWNIRDKDARDFMSEYVRMWNDPKSSKVHSLCEIKRRRLEGEYGIRHPSHWAAYSIKLGRL